MSARLALPHRRIHITQRTKIAGQRTLYLSVHDDEQPADRQRNRRPPTHNPLKCVTCISGRTSHGDEGILFDGMKTSSAQRTIGHCEQCHRSVSLRRPWQRFCSEGCRTRWHAQERRHALAAYRARQQEELEPII